MSSLSSPPHTPEELSTTTAGTADPLSPPDPLAAGLQVLLSPSIRTTAQKLSNVFLAQQELSGELERLVTQLQTYLDSTSPPALRATVLKLADTRKRLVAINNALQTLQTRINRVYLQLSRQRIPGPG